MELHVIYCVILYILYKTLCCIMFFMGVASLIAACVLLVLLLPLLLLLVLVKATNSLASPSPLKGILNKLPSN